MSRKIRPRRAAALLIRNPSYDSDTNSSESENEVDWYEKDRAALRKSGNNQSKKRTRKGTQRPAVHRRSTSSSKSGGRGGNSSAGRGRGRRRSRVVFQNANTSSIINLESDNETIDNDIKVTHLKNIENKVDNFFNSNNLMSDDDDDIDMKKIKIKTPPKQSKGFYTLSDSEDDILPSNVPPISKCKNSFAEASQGCSSINDKAECTGNNENDSLMVLVDQILECDDTSLEIEPVPDQSWNEYKSKTEKMLDSVTALLSEFKEEPVKPAEVIEKKSPERAKPTCPICLEGLRGTVIASATICGHIFCQECITKVAKSANKKCPTCRKAINVKKIHPVYL